MTLHVDGLRWHDPISVVGAPSRSERYGVVAPTRAIARVPRSWGRGIPGTRAIARVAAHCTPSTAFQRLTSRPISFLDEEVAVFEVEPVDVFKVRTHVSEWNPGPVPYGLPSPLAGHDGENPLMNGDQTADHHDPASVCLPAPTSIAMIRVAPISAALPRGSMSRAPPSMSIRPPTSTGGKRTGSAADAWTESTRATS